MGRGPLKLVGMLRDAWVISPTRVAGGYPYRSVFRLFLPFRLYQGLPQAFKRAYLPKALSLECSYLSG